MWRLLIFSSKNTGQCACCLKKGRRCRRFPRSFLSIQSCEESFDPSQTLGSKELSVHLKVQHLMKETSGECTECHCVQNKPPQSQGFQAVHEPSRNNTLKFHPGFPEMLTIISSSTVRTMKIETQCG